MILMRVTRHRQRCDRTRLATRLLLHIIQELSHCLKKAPVHATHALNVERSMMHEVGTGPRSGRAKVVSTSTVSDSVVKIRSESD